MIRLTTLGGANPSSATALLFILVIILAYAKVLFTSNIAPLKGIVGGKEGSYMKTRKPTPAMGSEKSDFANTLTAVAAAVFDTFHTLGASALLSGGTLT